MLHVAYAIEERVENLISCIIQSIELIYEDNDEFPLIECIGKLSSGIDSFREVKKIIIVSLKTSSDINPETIRVSSIDILKRDAIERMKENKRLAYDYADRDLSREKEYLLEATTIIF